MKQREELLDERSKKILRELVSLYCLTGEPVGSRTLSRRGKMGLSPATIRNVLADLEDLGYIEQPHTSAGRIPTDKGYRFYVTNLMRSHDLTVIQKEMIDSFTHNTAGSLRDILVLTTSLLASLSHNIALAITPNLDKLYLENIDFVPISGSRVLVILITRGGSVSNKVIELDDVLGSIDLQRIANYIKSEFKGQTLPTIRARILERMRKDQNQYDELVKKAMLLSQKMIDLAVSQEELVINGASQIINYPEFSDARKTRDLLEALEQKSRIVRLLTQCIEGDGIHILIGSENMQPDLQGLSLISSPYKYQNQSIGTLGILGPTRMEYSRMVPLVDHIAKVVSSILSRDN
jgi:heat-inducible transcriptional repressor